MKKHIVCATLITLLAQPITAHANDGAAIASGVIGLIGGMAAGEMQRQQQTEQQQRMEQQREIQQQRMEQQKAVQQQQMERQKAVQQQRMEQRINEQKEAIEKQRQESAEKEAARQKCQTMPEAKLLIMASCKGQDGDVASNKAKLQESGCDTETVQAISQQGAAKKNAITANANPFVKLDDLLEKQCGQ